MTDPTDSDPATSEPAADRYRRIAAPFTALVAEIDGADWDRPSPCEGWVARDIVVHLVEWIPGFFASVPVPPAQAAPPAPADPSALSAGELVDAWRSIDRWVQAALDDPAVATSTVTHQMAGTHRIDDAVMQFVAGDVLVHHWDLARSQGREVTLDPVAVAAVMAGFDAMGEGLSASGMFAPAVDVGSDADAQTRMLALSGRRP